MERMFKELRSEETNGASIFILKIMILEKKEDINDN